MTLVRRIATVTFVGAALLSAGAGISGADDSHQVLYEVWGSPGTSTAAVTYLGDNYNVLQDTNVALPWSKTITSSSSIPAWNMNVQNTASSGSISCRITVDGVVKDEETANGFAAIAECSVPS
ncbi:MmpS family transport accessory protein [Nocardia sp. NPDC101769]|uniref:MmpS family transport accessory protein n=1 Tax=Nocardia sp. NPDC101769 TaxID=3364333 RepID=UPI003814094F